MSQFKDYIAALNAKINSATEAVDVIGAAKAIEKLGIGTVYWVPTFNDLPLPNSSVPSNALYIVEGTGEVYYRSGSYWKGFGGQRKYAVTWTTRFLGDGTELSGANVISFGGVTDSAVHPFRMFSAAGDDVNIVDAYTSTFNGFSIALTDDGKIYTVGTNDKGQIGNNGIVNFNSNIYGVPGELPGGLTWSSLGTLNGGRNLVFAITDTGVGYGWGSNYQGALGNNTGVSQKSPVTVAGGLTWSSIHAGPFFSIGVTTDNNLYVWGLLNDGLGGNNVASGGNVSSPVSIGGGLSGWQKAAVGDRSHASAFLDSAGDSVMYAWGKNNGGQLGNDAAVNTSSPVTVVGGITNWSDVKCGEYHTVGLTSDGDIYAWGTNSSGQLGVGDTVNRSSPTTLTGSISNWSVITSGKYTNFAITTNGHLYGWGRDIDGTSGGTSTSSPTKLFSAFDGLWTNVHSNDGGGSTGIITSPTPIGFSEHQVLRHINNVTFSF